nr:hypothetical protein [Luteolibacter luteus]
MQQFLKFGTGTAGTRIIPAELFTEFLVSVDHPVTALHARFGWEALTALAAAFIESSSRLDLVLVSSWQPPLFCCGGEPDLPVSELSSLLSGKEKGGHRCPPFSRMERST